jgi:hypothetical protein
MALGIWVLFFLTLGLFAPTLLERFYQAWMKFAEVIGKFNFKLILGLLCFFYVHASWYGGFVISVGSFNQKN